jgi:hypothetical protein
MSAMSDYLEGQLRAHIFRTASFTKPTTLAVGLFTAAPSDAGGGTEVSGGSYARVAANPLDANWTAASSTDGVTTNASAITFAAPTANWGTVTHFGIYDATTAGNLLMWGALTASRVISNGDAAPSFAAGALSVTFA